MSIKLSPRLVTPRFAAGAASAASIMSGVVTANSLNHRGEGVGVSAPDLPRPLLHLRSFGRNYPKAWAVVDRVRAGRGPASAEWPQWCFLPVAGAYQIVSGGPALHNAQKLQEVAKLAAFAAWRATQGIYRFDPTVFEQLWNTPVEGDLPAEVLLRLPEWCVYVETPGKYFGKFLLHGFFVHLEFDADAGRSELHLLLDTNEGFYLVPLHLKGDLHTAISLAWEQAQRNRREFFARGGSNAAVPSTAEPTFDLVAAVTPLVSLVLYLCSVSAEVRDRAGTGRQPSNPKPTKTKQGERHFAPERTTVWEVAYRLGAMLRAAGSDDTPAFKGSAHAGPRPHIRRAHWHSFWTGPRRLEGKREIVVKWLPPVAVNAESNDQLVPVIRRMERNHPHV